MSSLKQVSLSVAALGAIVAVGASSTPAQALNVVSGSVSGIWDYDYDGAGGLNVGDSFTADYTYDSDSVTTYDYSYPGNYTSISNSAPLLSLVLNSGTVSKTFNLNSDSIDHISWYDYKEEPSYGQFFRRVFQIYAHDSIYDDNNFSSSYIDSLYVYNDSGQDSDGLPFSSSSASGYFYNYGTGAYLNAISKQPLIFSGSPATPVPTPALLPGLVGLGMAALRKRKQNQGQEAVKTAQS
jgi:hypothetical protein